MNEAGTIRTAGTADVEQITAVINAAFKIAENFFVDGNRITIEAPSNATPPSLFGTARRIA